MASPVTIPVGPLGYNEIVLEPSQGRVRAIEIGGRIQFQDPDLVVAREYPDGRIVSGIRNLFTRTTDSVTRLRFDYGAGRLEDSFGKRVPVTSVKIPDRGVTFQFRFQEATWSPLGVDPRRFTPGPNQEIVERVVFLDRDGNLIVENFSYGLGSKYDRTKTGAKWRYAAARALGEESDPGPGNRLTTAELQKAVLEREFLVKTTQPVR